MQNMADQKWSDFSAVFNRFLYAFQIRQTVIMLLFEAIEFHAIFKPIGNPRSHLELTCEYKLYTLRNTKVSTPIVQPLLLGHLFFHCQFLLRTRILWQTKQFGNYPFRQSCSSHT